MKPAFSELATNACTDARGISLVKIMRFHACAISSADMSLRVSAINSAFTAPRTNPEPTLALAREVVRDEPLRGVKACVFDAYGTLFDFASAAKNCPDVPADTMGKLTALHMKSQGVPRITIVSPSPGSA